MNETPEREAAMFSAARKLGPAARVAFLEGLGFEDPGLRARVEQLLRADEEAAGFLPELVTEAGDDDQAAMEARLALLDSEFVGGMVDRYRLMERLGEGGCGVVYVAEQTEPVRRRVALKVIKLGMDTKAMVARFAAEGQALAMMDHPNIAKVLDAGTTGRGRPYFVMELVRGIRITDYCDQANLSTRDRLALFIQACHAIQHAHQKGIIHRDIKPSNILVTLHDGVPVPKVIDFGIAKATEGRLTDQTLYTQLHQMIGTPAYMSPEQAEMSGLDIDTRSDIYSLGVLLYELLVGSTPFDAEELARLGLDKMRQTLREQEPVRPSTKLEKLADEELTTTAKRRSVDASRLACQLRGDLDWIVMKCLEKDRSRRYETVNGLAADLKRHLGDEPVLARPPSRRYRLQTFVRRHKRGVVTTLVVAVALVLLTAVSVVAALRARQAERQQSLLRNEALQARNEATAKLREAYLAQAQANRFSGRDGRRFESLAVLRKAAAIRPSLELRNEAIGCMALADIRLAFEKHFRQDEEFATTDQALERYLVVDRKGSLSLRRVSDDGEIRRLPDIGIPARFEPTISPNGRYLAAPYGDGNVRVWDLVNGGCMLTAPIEPRCEFSPDSQILAVQRACQMTLYRAGTGEKLRTISQDTLTSSAARWDFAFNPEGSRLAIASEESPIVLLVDVASGQVARRLTHPGIIRVIAWHPGGRYLACACADNLIHIWDTETGEAVEQLRGHQNAPVSVTFSHEGSLLASAGFDGRVRLWDHRNGRQLVSITNPGMLKFSPDDRYLVSQRWAAERLSFFEVSNGSECRTIHQRGQRSDTYDEGVAFSRTGEILAYATPQGPVLWDFRAGTESACAGPYATATHSVAFDLSGAGVIASSSSTPLCRWVWNGTTETRGGAHLGLGTPVSVEVGYGRMCVSGDGSRLAVVRAGRCSIFDGRSFETTAVTDAQPGMRYVAISGDGAIVATGPWHEKGVRVWDARTGRLLSQLPTEDSANVAVSPNGDRIVTSTGAEFRFWATGSWTSNLRVRREAGDDLPGAMAFSPDGRVFAGTYNRTMVRLFDSRTGRELASLEPLGAQEVTALAFDAAGNRLAVCEGPVAVRVWDLGKIRAQLARMELNWPDVGP